MICSRWARCCAAGLLLGLGLCGCAPGGDSRVDEEREPHFLAGRKLASQMDYEGAVDEYEKALMVNPQSASAHFELAWLYEGKQNDPAAAIYHYQRFLKLAPASGKADVAQAHISNCKLDLAKSASAIAPISASAQRDLERLLQENKDLKALLAQWSAYYPGHPPGLATNPPPPTVSTNPVPSITITNNSRANGAPSIPVVATRPASPAATRTHTIAGGETLRAIARKYSVPLSALQAANPQAEPTHLRVGSTLVIPAP